MPAGGKAPDRLDNQETEKENRYQASNLLRNYVHISTRIGAAGRGGKGKGQRGKKSNWVVAVSHLLMQLLSPD